MSKPIEGMLVGKGLKFGLVVSRFNDFITKKLMEGAEDALIRHGVEPGDIDVAWVPGSFEIPWWPANWPRPSAMTPLSAWGRWSGGERLTLSISPPRLPRGLLWWA